VHQASQMVIINGYGVEVIIVVLQPETYFFEYLTKSSIKYTKKLFSKNLSSNKLNGVLVKDRILGKMPIRQFSSHYPET
jgi:hypothetical protein